MTDVESSWDEAPWFDVSEAASRFDLILDLVAFGRVVRLVRNGKAVAVVVRADRYEALRAAAGAAGDEGAPAVREDLPGPNEASRTAP